MATITVVVSSKIGTHAWRISEAEDVNLREWCRTRGQALPDVINVLNSLVLSAPDTIKEVSEVSTPNLSPFPIESQSVSDETTKDKDSDTASQESSGSGDPFRINGTEEKSKKERR